MPVNPLTQMAIVGNSYLYHMRKVACLPDYSPVQSDIDCPRIWSKTSNQAWPSTWPKTPSHLSSTSPPQAPRSRSSQPVMPNLTQFTWAISAKCSSDTRSPQPRLCTPPSVPPSLSTHGSHIPQQRGVRAFGVCRSRARWLFPPRLWLLYSLLTWLRC